MNINLSVDFQAAYPSYLQTKQSSLKSIIQRINDFFKRMILSLFSSHLFGETEILRTVNESNRLQINGFADEVKQLKLKTPDGRCIEATLLSNSQPANEKTVILFSGSGYSHEYFSPSMVHSYLNLGYRVLCFNYGGFGNSEGSPSQHSIELDAETVYQYVTQDLGVQNENLVLHGYSLGSYPATFLSSHYPVGKLVIDRGFNQISAAAEKEGQEEFGVLACKIAKILINYCAPFDNQKKLKKIESSVFIVNEESNFYYHEALVKSFVEGSKISKEELQQQGRLVCLKIPMEHEHTYESLWFRTDNYQHYQAKIKFEKFLTPAR